LPLHLAMHITLRKHLNFELQILAIVDIINLLGSFRETTVFYFELNIVLKEVIGVQLNLQESSLLALQLHLVVDPVSFMEPIYQQADSSFDPSCC
jgi:hypothetical protein